MMFESLLLITLTSVLTAAKVKLYRKDARSESDAVQGFFCRNGTNEAMIWNCLNISNPTMYWKTRFILRLHEKEASTFFGGWEYLMASQVFCPVELHAV